MISRPRPDPSGAAADAAAAAPWPVHTTQTKSGFLPERIVHLHPTRLCNLACTHCYSESDPGHSTMLRPALLAPALALLRQEGYRQVSLSGGEPLVYPHLAEVVAVSKALGLRVSLVSNGLLATRRFGAVLAQMDGIAISFDGLAARHNAVRGRADAFDRAGQALQRLAEQGAPVAAAISLTRDGIEELPDLADHLVGLGAKALQIRPVARAGRAQGLDAAHFFGASDQARLYLVVLALQQELAEAGVRVHCDLAPAQGLWQQRAAYAGLLAHCEVRPLAQRPLSDLVNPLVITETGALKPIAYDFDARFDIGNLAALSADTLRCYKEQAAPRLQTLLASSLAAMEHRAGWVDWFDHLARQSEIGATKAVNLHPVLVQRQGYSASHDSRSAQLLGHRQRRAAGPVLAAERVLPAA